ncbi:MAG: cyclic 2,3-diphosphoglycerate synthase [Nanoarchaeota archaeon]
MPKKNKVIIMGAAGRDFHNFNTFFRDNSRYDVIAFTVAQIIGISNRRYPKELSGRLYPRGIPIYPEKQLPDLIRKHKIDEVVLAYSDLKHDSVMEKASLVLAVGADFKLMGMNTTAIRTEKPLITVCAIRTGAGKGTISREILNRLRSKGFNPVVIRHPMPYGDLKKQTCQRFATQQDMDKYNPTIEEREEYEPYVERGFVVYSGVDYGKILKQAEKEGDIIVFEGGNNDIPFYTSKRHLKVVVADPLRPNDVFSYPGESNVIMADVIIMNKINVASNRNIKLCEEKIRTLNKKVPIIRVRSVVTVDRPELIKGKKVLVVEDSPTVTHGGLGYAAGLVAAQKYKSAKHINPKRYAVGSIKKIFEENKHLKHVLPSAGYTKTQLKDLEATIKKIHCDTVILGTPVNLSNIIKIRQPIARVSYKPKEIRDGMLDKILNRFLKNSK